MLEEYTPYDVAVQRATKTSSQLDLDDAFGDGDEQGVAFEFNVDTARNDLSTYTGWDEAQDTAEDLSADQTHAVNSDQALDTVDLNGTPPTPHSGRGANAIDSPPTISRSQSNGFHSPATSLDTPGELDSISLSVESTQPSVLEPEEQEIVVDVDKHLEATPRTAQVRSARSPHPYPSVHIVAGEHPAVLEAHETSPEDVRRPTVSTVSLDIPIRPATPDETTTPHSAPSSTPTFPHLPSEIPDPQPSSSTATVNGASAHGSLSPPSPSVSRHKPSRSIGPSTFEKFMSKTRPSFLPPKSKVEDQKHLADWETMMQRSRAAEVKRRKELEERRMERERKVEQSLHVWHNQILPDWRVLHKDPVLKRLWWSGIPPTLRATMWERAVGNSLALSKDNYRACLARAKRALSGHTFPEQTLMVIEEDISKTLPSLHIFLEGTGPLHDDLKDMLCAWVVSRADEGLGYVSGVARIAGMLLISMPAQQGFIVMRNLLERHCMRSFFGGPGAKDDVEAYYRIFDTLLADGMPKIYFNFKQHQISPSAYLPDWIIPMFLDHLPFEACARLWDVIILEGDAFLFRAALAILAALEPRLFFPDRRELLELLSGENKAAIEVAKRNGRSMDGGKYEIYDIDEEVLWERIDSMDDWWKESTWKRLLQRELPDV